MLFEIPRQPEPKLFETRQWPRACLALYILATHGTSVRYEIAEALGKQFAITPDCGSLARLFRLLGDMQLTITQDFSIVKRLHLAGIRLSERGKEYCQSMGWTVIENDWERLLRLHCADTQVRHAGAVLAFAYQARRRGWTVTVLPQTNMPNFYPDALVEKDEQRHYVEVELGTQKQGKWVLNQKLQGYVALCARTPTRCDYLINECAEVGAYGIATDLWTLAKSASTTRLWPRSWSVEYNFSYTDFKGASPLAFRGGRS